MALLEGKPATEGHGGMRERYGIWSSPFASAGKRQPAV